MQNNTVNTSQRDGQIFLCCILLFFFVVMSVNGYFVYEAITTHNGTVDLIHGK